MPGALQILILLSAMFPTMLLAQFSPGLAFYTTGSEQGIGYRSSKEMFCAIDLRISKLLLNTDTKKQSSAATEVSVVFRVVASEKLRFHIGGGYKADWLFPNDHKHGFVLPLGIEAFPFPFQNAGLFFESAPFALWDRFHHAFIGIRTTAGFVIYFHRLTRTTS